MRRIHTPEGDLNKQTTYQVLFRILTVLVVILAVIVMAVPGVLRLMYRADAQVALGNAKSVRLALQTVSKDAYGEGGQFGDISGTCGITEGLETEVYMLAKVPGDFQVLQVDESGYEVICFQYVENEMLVTYDGNTDTYEVQHMTQYIQTEDTN